VLERLEKVKKPTFLLQPYKILKKTTK